MMDCQIARRMVHEAPVDSVVQAHLSMCPHCAAYAAHVVRLDQVLPSLLVVPAPPAVALQLQSLIAPRPTTTYWETMLRAEVITPAPPTLTERLLALIPEQAMLPGRVDATLREELTPPVPATLAARLQVLVPATGSLTPQLRPRRWVIGAVYLITAVLLSVGLMVAGSLYHLILTQLGLMAWWTDIAGLPALLLNDLYSYVPQARVVVAAIVWLQQPLQWLLAALLIWAALDSNQVQPSRRHA